MGCGSCARVVLLLFNLIFFLIGAASLGVGIWVVVDSGLFLDVLGNIPDSGNYGRLIRDAAYIFIAAGAVIFIIAFLGCCGAWKKVQCLLMTYAIVIGILLALQIAVVVVAYFFYDNVVTTLNDGLAKALTQSYNSNFTNTGTFTYDYKPGDLISKGVDAIQVEFVCCGVNNYTDYKNSMYPPTCCNASNDKTVQQWVDGFWGGQLTTYSSSISYNQCQNFSDPTFISGVPGCTKAISDFVREKSMIVMIIAGVTLAVQLLLIIFACCLFCDLRDEERKL